MPALMDTNALKDALSIIAQVAGALAEPPPPARGGLAASIAHGNLVGGQEA
jgi:hypothetical protein